MILASSPFDTAMSKEVVSYTCKNSPGNEASYALSVGRQPTLYLGMP